MSRRRMTTRTVLYAGALAVCQTAGYPQSDAREQADGFHRRQGEITADDVYVRSGPSLNHYTVLKLNAGNRVTVLGETGDWFEILPPEGAFSLISGDYVDVAPEGTRGVVNGDRVRVRAGSQLNDSKYTVQMKLDKGAEVTVHGRNPDGFLRIVPPNGTTLWISKTFVALIPQEHYGESTSDTTSGVPSSAPRTEGSKSPSSPAHVADGAERDGSVAPAESSAVARQTASSAFEGSTLTPARRTLDQIDADAHGEMAKPMNQRRLEPLIKRYEAVAADESDVLAARYARERVRQLRDVQSIIETVREMRRVSDESDTARQEFLQQRASIPDVTPSTPSALDARGTLRESALYPPDRRPRRLRLVDETQTPARTVAYVDVTAEFVQPLDSFLDRRVGLRAVASTWQTGGVEPIRIYTVGEFVLLDEFEEKTPTSPSEQAPSTDNAAGGEESTAGSDS